MSTTLTSTKEAVIQIESWVAKYVGNECEAARKLPGGERIANEILASVGTLFLARSAAIIHVWTGESIDSIRKRFIESFDANLKTTMEKINVPSDTTKLRE